MGEMSVFVCLRVFVCLCLGCGVACVCLDAVSGRGGVEGAAGGRGR